MGSADDGTCNWCGSKVGRRIPWAEGLTNLRACLECWRSYLAPLWTAVTFELDVSGDEGSAS